MKTHPSITPDRIEAAVLEGDCAGFCASCGADAYGVEPDARRYECESCGEHMVYGAEEIAILAIA